MKKIKAEIKDYEGCLWLEINGNDETAWAIRDNEVLAIRNACDEYIVKKCQDK